MKLVILNDKYAVSVGVGYTLGEWNEVEKENVKTKEMEKSIILSNTTYPSSWKMIYSSLLDKIVKDKMKDVISLKEYVELIVECKKEVIKIGNGIDEVLKDFDKEE